MCVRMCGCVWAGVGVCGCGDVWVWEGDERPRVHISSLADGRPTPGSPRDVLVGHLGHKSCLGTRAVVVVMVGGGDGDGGSDGGGW